MDINFVHCFFEQSGVFKNAFKKNNIPAADYDIKNEYGQTDFIIDLFSEIEKKEGKSIFDNIKKNDLIFAFFPCLYFCENNQLFFTAQSLNFNNKTKDFVINKIIERAEMRNKYYIILLKLVEKCLQRSLKLIIENPYSKNSYLYNNFPLKPSVIDFNRNERGDKFKKPTQYFFLNCDPCFEKTSIQTKYKVININALSGHFGSYCSKERSEITPEYANNFICDFLLNKKTQFTEKTLFDYE